MGHRIRKAALAAAVVTMMAAQSAAAGPSIPDRTDATFQQDCLTALNTARAAHGAPALTTDQSAVDVARRRVQQQGPDGQLNQHTGLPLGYGETLYSGSAGSELKNPDQAPHTCGDAVARWYSEHRSYDYADPGHSTDGRETGNFTMLVWKSTTKVGCARAADWHHDGEWYWYDTYVVCDFTPQGNVRGQYAENVLPPQSATGHRHPA
ncbi:CAP domain-containing protein [Kitasatospora sp. NPDC091335]|uniref:CAP domain-containing protein n=1 Tax=Kitasatospora sp. NPDC091335 TaxID=3364085 RepID=UPI00382778EF